jgi:hypothetical protein
LLVQRGRRSETTAFQRLHPVQLLLGLQRLRLRGGELRLLLRDRHGRDHLAALHIAAIGKIDRCDPFGHGRGQHHLFISKGSADCLQRVVEAGRGDWPGLH